MLPRNSYKYLFISALAACVFACDAYYGHRALHKSETGSAASARPAIAEPQAIAKPRLSTPSAPAPEIAPDVGPGFSATTATSTGNSDREILTQQLQKIEADYAAIAQPIYDQSSPLLQKEDRAKLTYLENEKLADLGKVLAPAELELYQNSPAPDSAPRRR